MSVLFLTFLLLPGCGKGSSEALSAGSVNLLSMLPENSTGVVFINFKDLSKLEFFDKMIKEKKSEKTSGLFYDYQDFVNKTGIDPQKDVFAMVLGIIGDLNPGPPNAIAVVNLNYNKDKILNLMNEQKLTLSEEIYKGITIYTFKEIKENGVEEVNAFAFINDNIATFAKPDGVKQVIDLSKNEGKSIMANAALKPYIEKFSGLTSFVFDLPGDFKKIHDLGMSKIDLTKAEVVLGNFNFKDNAYIGEISLICHNKEGNEQLVNTLNGFKGMAALAGEEAMALVNKITITATPEKVTLSFNIPTELLEKLKKKMDEKMKATTEPIQPAQPTQPSQSSQTSEQTPLTTE